MEAKTEAQLVAQLPAEAVAFFEVDRLEAEAVALEMDRLEAVKVQIL